MQYKDFYSELGKLLYAVANIDGIVTPREKKRLMDIVKQELVPVEQHVDSFGTDVAYYTEMEFDYLDEHMTQPEDALESFYGFMETHYAALDENMKKLCLYFTEELAAASYGINKREKSFLEQLKYKLVIMELSDLIKKNRQIKD